MFGVDQITNWFLVEHTNKMSIDGFDESLTQMKLHKLLYYSQGIYLGLFGEPLFEEDILAWKHGPVIYSLYDKYRGEKEIQRPLIEKDFLDYKELSSDDRASIVLTYTYFKYGAFSAGRLRNMTHKETPWINAWKATNGFSIISQESLKKYFSKKIKYSDVVNYDKLSLLDEDDSKMVINLINSIYGESFSDYQVEQFPEDSGVYVTIFDKSKTFEENIDLLNVLKKETIDIEGLHLLIGG